MHELYFFRNVSDYEELEKKTRDAYLRNSRNKKRVYITKTIELESSEFTEIVCNLKRSNIIFVENNKIMRIKNGIWICISIKSFNREIVVMTDGYPYPKFVALRNFGI